MTWTPEEELALARTLLEASRLTSKLGLEVPENLAPFMDRADDLLRRVEDAVGSATVGPYLDVSKRRYRYYFAAALSLAHGSSILDVGNAPGHVGIGLHLAGMKVTGLNLNAEWRKTYPSSEWLERLNVLEHDIEGKALPFPEATFDALFFTEVLEHIAVRDPLPILIELRRVLKPGGLFLLSTPNVSNLSNILALLSGKNIFWPRNLFYGSLDRHNREFTSAEVLDLVTEARFREIGIFGINSDCNWRAGGNEAVYRVLAEMGDFHPLLRNTTLILAKA